MDWALVVEDDPDNRVALRWMLEDAGYQVAEAADGLTALRLLRETPHRYVVLLDRMLPDVTGEALLAVVATDRALATRHRYLLLTASRYSPTDAEWAMLTALGVPLIAKPFDMDALLAAVEAAHSIFRPAKP